MGSTVLASNVARIPTWKGGKMRKSNKPTGRPARGRSRYPMTSCLAAAPLFMDAAANDYRLQATSPAVDAGTDHPAYDTFQTLYGLDLRQDLCGHTRPEAGAFDIGAFECP